MKDHLYFCHYIGLTPQTKIWVDGHFQLICDGL